jgi:hypothetical protein
MICHDLSTFKVAAIPTRSVLGALDHCREVLVAVDCQDHKEVAYSTVDRTPVAVAPLRTQLA